MPTITSIDLYAGIAGFHLGLSAACRTLDIRHRCVLAAEIDPAARLVYSTHFPDVPILHDIRRLTGREARDVDILTAGSPCQSFSAGGPRTGLEDPRGRLVFETIRLAMTMQPRCAVLENADHLASAAMKSAFDEILAAIDAAGYDIFHEVLDAHEIAGVPQKRKRLLICCFRKDLGIIDFEFPGPTGQRSCLADVLEPNPPLSAYLSESHWRKMKNKASHPPVIRDAGDIAGTVTRPGDGDRRNLIRGPVPATTEQYGDRQGPINSEGIRRLTTVERERCQGLPDGWTSCVKSRDARHGLIGNAIPPPLVEAVMGGVLKAIAKPPRGTPRPEKGSKIRTLMRWLVEDITRVVPDARVELQGEVLQLAFRLMAEPESARKRRRLARLLSEVGSVEAGRYATELNGKTVP